MSNRFSPRIPDESIVKLYKQKVEEKHGRLYAVLGEEAEQALKLHLMVKFDVDFSDDLRLEELLDAYLGVAHTQNHECNMSVTVETNDLKKPEDCKTKRERAYFAMSYLKRNHLEQITHGNYVKACSDLFGQSDYRTVKTNLEILTSNGALVKLRMRNVGKKNIYKQIYKFHENDVYPKFNSARSLQEFIKSFKESFKGRKQITLNEIKKFIEEDYVITDTKFVEERANYLKNEGILEKHVQNPVIFNIVWE